MLYKSLKQSVKDVDEAQGIITGYFASIGTVDTQKDVFVKGAFKKTIRERGPKGTNQIFHLFMHDVFKPLGKPSVLIEDDKGLYFETKISKTTYGKDVLRLYLDGIINEHSVGFEIIKEREKDGIREIKEVKLWEGSSVIWGANPNTPTTDVKILKKNIENINKALERGHYTDETFILLENELQKLNALISRLCTDEPSDEEKEVQRFVELLNL